MTPTQQKNSSPASSIWKRKNETPSYRKLANAALFHYASRLSEPLYSKLVEAHTVEQAKESPRRKYNGVGALIDAGVARLNTASQRSKNGDYLKKHSLEVAYFSYITASEAVKEGVEREIDPKICFVGGLLHDIGQTYLPDSLVGKEYGVRILFFDFFKGARLNEVERRTLRNEHLIQGKRFIESFRIGENLEDILNMIEHHHVMYDRTKTSFPSYPEHLMGNELPAASRIVKLADFISAVLPRHYKKDPWIMTMEDAVAYAIVVAGRDIDPKLLGCFLGGTYDMDRKRIQKMVDRLKAPNSIKSEDNASIRIHTLDRVSRDSEFLAMINRRSLEKVLRYKAEIETCAIELKTPILAEICSLQ